MVTDDGVASSNNNNRRNNEHELSESLKTFGSVLKALREEVHLTQETYAPRVGYSVAYVGKIEQGKRYPPRDLATRSRESLGPTAARVLQAALDSLSRKTGLAAWFRQWAGIEEDAISLCAYECRAIPGLLQPESYIRAAFERRLPPLSEEQIGEQVTARLKRQELLTQKPNTAFSFIIEQALLERQLGGTQVTRDVLDLLLERINSLNVEIQIMPLRQEEHAGIDGLMYLAETPRHDWIGYSEGQQSSILITDPKDVSAMLQRYGMLRSQALGRKATVTLLKEMRGAL